MNRLALGEVSLFLTLVLTGVSATAQDQKPKDKEAPLFEGKPLAEWIKALKDKDVAVRFKALQVLGQAGPQAKEAVPPLLDMLRDKELGSLFEAVVPSTLAGIGPPAVPALGTALKDPQPIVRRVAAFALRLIGPGAKEAMPALIAALDDEQAMVRMQAASALGAIGPDARASVTKLGMLVEKDKDVRVRIEAAVASWRVTNEAPPAVAALIAALKEKDVTVRQSAAQGLGLIGAPAAEALPLLREAIKERDVGLRREAAFAISQFGDQARSAQAPIRMALEDRDAGVRWWGAMAALNIDLTDRTASTGILDAVEDISGRLAATGRSSEAVTTALRPGAVKPLVKALNRKDVRLRQEACRMLGILGPEAREAVPALLAALKDDDEVLRRRASDALSRLGQEVVPVLLRAFLQNDSRTREGTARALGAYGPASKKAVAQFQLSMQEKDIPVQVQASLAMWHVEGDGREAIPALIAVVDKKDSPARAEAMEALGIIGLDIGTGNQPLTETLTRGLKDRDSRVRMQAIRALWRIDRQPRVVVPLLRPLLEDDDNVVRTLAVEVLGELGPEGKTTPLLIEALKDKDAGVRRATVVALARGGSEPVPSLIKTLSHESPMVRADAARALGWIGSAADPAVKALLGMIADQDELAGKRAERAVHDIGPEDADALIQKAKKPR